MQATKAVQQTYITFDTGKIFLVTAHAPTHDLNGKTVEFLRKFNPGNQGRSARLECWSYGRAGDRTR